MGLGLTYTGSYSGEWSYYLDYETVLTHKDVTIVDVPADLETQTYSMEYEQSGHLVQVGFRDNDVYVQGISENNVPKAWWKGTIGEDGKLVFPLQFAQVYSTYLLYFCGADFEGETTEAGGTTWKYHWTDGSATFDLDPGARTFSTGQAVCVNNADDHVERGETFRAPFFRPYTEKAATPADPSVEAYIDYFDLANISIMMPKVPLLDTLLHLRKGLCHLHLPDRLQADWRADHLPRRRRGTPFQHRLLQFRRRRHTVRLQLHRGRRNGKW